MNDNKNEGCQKISADDLLLAVYGELEDENSIAHIESCRECQDYIKEVTKLRGVAKLAGMRAPESGLTEISKLEKMAEETTENVKKLDIFGKSIKTDVKFYGIISKAAVVFLIATALIVAVLAGGKLYQKPAYLSGIYNDLLQIESDMDAEIIVVFNDTEDDDILTGLIGYEEEFEDMEVAMADIEDGLFLYDLDDADKFSFLDEDF